MFLSVKTIAPDNYYTIIFYHVRNKIGKYIFHGTLNPLLHTFHYNPTYYISAIESNLYTPTSNSVICLSSQCCTNML